MLLDERFLEEDGITAYRIEKNFYSKKNNVYKVKCSYPDRSEKIYIVKQYYQEMSKIKEIDLLSKLQEEGLEVPKLYYKGRDHCIIEYLKGPTLLEVISEREKSAIISSNTYLIIKFSQWFKKFYTISKKITGKNLIFRDVNLRNFIYSNKIYGIDFEDCCEGRIEEDVGRICAFILTYSPSFTLWKTNFIKEIFSIFKKEFMLKDDVIKAEMEKELEAISKRRRTF